MRLLLCTFALLFSAITSSGAATLSDTLTPNASGERLVIASIQLLGNKITRDDIILRELTFHLHDTVPAADLDKRFRRSEENLLNTSLFHKANITWLQNGRSAQVFIIVTERWYIFPIPIFEIAERNFNVWWKEKDFSRLVYGGTLNWSNFRGRNEVLSATLRLGYTERLSLYYGIPFINHRQKSGLAFGMYFSGNHQTSVRTANDKLLYYKNEDVYARKEAGAYVQFTHRRNLYQTHMLEAGFRTVHVTDTVMLINRDYLNDTRQPTQEQYFTFRYFFKSDHRDAVVYPLKGYYVDAEIGQTGLPLTKDPVNITSLTGRYKRFWKLGAGFFFGAGATAKVSGSSWQPYYHVRALGYGREFLRGYEYYVIDGQHFALLKSDLKYQLCRKRELHVAALPFTKFNTIPYAFYLNLYSDAGYVKDKQFSTGNPLTNKWQYSFGTGLDFVTYYDMVFRFEYSMNRMGETGFFIHFTAPI